MGTAGDLYEKKLELERTVRRLRDQMRNLGENLGNLAVLLKDPDHYTLDQVPYSPERLVSSRKGNSINLEACVVDPKQIRQLHHEYTSAADKLQEVEKELKRHNDG